MLIYTGDGTMAVLISYGQRKPLSVADRIAAPLDERADAFATFLAYAGRYSLSETEVTHHVELASVEHWVGTDLVRVVQLDGDRLTLRTPPIPVDGVERITELTWERRGER